MTKIGITGQQGFVGYHLATTLSLDPEFQIIPFDRSFFNNSGQLRNFVKECDVIVHLAAMNRHEDQNVIYQTNLKLVDQLIEALNNESAKPHVYFSSSAQEERDNLYGKSKREGKQKFVDWAAASGGLFTSFNIPNVFGPFGKPNYNSVVATFCHKVAHDEEAN